MQSHNTVSPHFGFYGILTNPIKGYEYVTEVMVELSLPFIQLRMKNVPQIAILKIAQKLKKITEKTSSRLIINDDPQIALDCGADGVHIGQDDLPIDQVRNCVGPQMLIGLSTHSPAQTEDACKKKPDYIGIGPLFPTPTKEKADQPIGIDGMKSMLEISNVPSVCIGGITLEHLPQLYNNGMKNFCMVRPINESIEPRVVLKRIIDAYRSLSEENT